MGRSWPAAVGALLLVTASLLFPALGAGPFERAEIYFVDGARSMVERGDWLVPYYRGEPFFDKPALTYWLIAASFQAFGFSAGAARLVSAVAALLVVLATLALGRRLFDRASAVAGGAILVTTLAFTSFGRIAMSDMLLALWTMLAAILAVDAVRRDAPGWALPALGAVLGLGFQTKGPVALLLPGLAVLLLLWQRGLPRVRPGTAAAAAAGFAVLGLGWFVLVFARLGAEPLEYFFLRENVERFAGETYDAQREAWYYLPTYLAEGAPWSCFLPLAAWRLIRAGDSGARFLLAWLGLMAVPLSLSRGKIDYYLLPLYPAASLVIGRYFTASTWDRLDRGWARGVLLGAVVALACLPVVGGAVPSEWLPEGPAVWGFAAVLIAGSLAALLAARRPTPGRTLVTLACVTASLFLGLVAFFLPAFRGSQPHRAVVEDVARERRYRHDAALAVCEDDARLQREVLFRLRLAVHENCALWAVAASPHPFLMLLSPSEHEALAELPGLREVDRYRYLPAGTLSLRGLLAGPEPATVVLVANFPTDDPVAETKRKRERKRALRATAEAAEADP